MAFIGKWFGSKKSNAAAIPEAPEAPTMGNSSAKLDTAATDFARAQAGGATSTVVSGTTGVDDKTKTSKILLGG